jgi:hypothetical protein
MTTIGVSVGWSLGSTADKMAKEQSERSVASVREARGTLLGEIMTIFSLIA